MNHDENKDVQLALNKIPPAVTEKELREFILSTIKEKIILKEIVCTPILVHKHQYNRWILLVDKKTALLCLSLEGKVVSLYFLLVID